MKKIRNMFSLLTHCFVCHNEATKQEAMFKVTKKDEQIINKLVDCSFEIDWLDINTTISICNACYIRLQIANDFIEMCRKNSVILKGYVVQLNHSTDTTKDDIQNEPECESDVVFVKENVIHKMIENKNVPVESRNVSDKNLLCTSINMEKEEEEQENNENIETKIDINESDISLKEENQETKQNEINFVQSLSTNLCKIWSNNTNVQSDIINIEINQNKHNIEMVMLDEEPEENLFLQEEEFQPEQHLMSNTDVNIVIEQQTISENDSEDQNLFQCAICEKKFTYKSRLQIHMRTHTGEKAFACKYCDKRYTRIENLNQHTLIVHNVKPFKCSQCGDSFMFRKNLTKHRLTHGSKRKQGMHNGEQNEGLKCTVCEKDFSMAQDFKQHMLLLHVNQSTRQCKLCNKIFAREIYLERHIMLHSGEEPHTCSICAETFLLRYRLREHMSIHKGQRYSCLLCGKMFHFKTSLNRHLKVHNRSKSFQCEFCKKCFSTAEYLKHHQAFHNGERRYECDVCHQKFALRQTMKFHKLKHVTNENK